MMTLQDLGVIALCTLFAAFGFPLIQQLWQDRARIARFLHGRYVMSRDSDAPPPPNTTPSVSNRSAAATTSNGETSNNGIAMPPIPRSTLLSRNEMVALANDPKVDPVDVILWEGRADALAALVAAGALKVTETEAAILIYGVKPSGTSPRWKLVRAAVDAAKTHRAPPRYQPLDEQRKPVLES